MAEQMNAVRLHQHGGPEVLRYEAVARPEIADDEVLLEVGACALNHLDVWTRLGRRGAHPISVSLPRILGSDVAGTVRKVGPRVAANGFPRVGDRVVVVPGAGCQACSWCQKGDENYCAGYRTLGSEIDGGYAQWMVIPGRDLVRMPQHLDFIEAACLPLTYMTAWQMLVTKAKLRAGETVLINAVGSGVGTAALQIATMAGARVVVTASSRAKIDKAIELGAAGGIVYTEDTFGPAVLGMTGGRGVDVVIDSVGSSTFEHSVDCLAVGGRMASCGATAGASVEIDLHTLQGKRATFYFTVMGTRSDLLQAAELVERHHLRPRVHEILPLEQAPQAHRLLESRTVFGKVVLVPEAA